mgnify:CR=1 FL=1
MFIRLTRKRVAFMTALVAIAVAGGVAREHPGRRRHSARLLSLERRQRGATAHRRERLELPQQRKVDRAPFGGGYSAPGDLDVHFSFPIGTNIWSVTGNRPVISLPGPPTLTAFAICANTN